MRYWLMFCLLIVGSQIFAQQDGEQTAIVAGIQIDSMSNRIYDTKNDYLSSTETLDKGGDKLYEKMGYKSSAETFRGKLKSEDLTDATMAKMANSYRLNSEYEEAEYWYTRFIQEDSKPEQLLNYAKVLHANGKCEDAVEWYNRYEKVADLDEKNNRDFIKDCDEIKTFKDHKNIEIYNVEALNTSHYDFSPVFYKDGVVFTSTRGSETRLIANKDIWTTDNFSDLFFAKKDKDNSFSNPEPLRGDINGKYHDGTATFSASGKVMIFARNNYEGKSKKGLKDLKIYSAYMDENGYWVNVETLPFCSDDFTTCHPTLAPDGKTLYFASDRPGGYGGLDIYVSKMENNKWAEPKNLGPVVNSSDHDNFPHISHDGYLYFASKGHMGLGGIDLFKVKRMVGDEEDSWGVRENMGTPFNSTKDDFGLILNHDGTEGYFNSNRAGGFGGDDIYSWTKVASEDEEMINSVCVYNEANGDKITDAKVVMMSLTENDFVKNEDLTLTLKPVTDENEEFILSIKNPNQEEVVKNLNYATNENGYFDMKYKMNQKFKFLVTKNGFEDHEVIASAEEINNGDFCIPMNKKMCSQLTGVVVNKEYDVAMPNATIKILNKCTNEEMVIETGVDGRFENCLECGCEYRIMGRKEKFNDDYAFISTENIDCTNPEPQDIKLRLAKSIITVVKTEAAPPVETTTRIVVREPRMKAVTTYVPQTTYVPKVTYVPVEDEYVTYMPNNPNAYHNPESYFLGDPNASFKKGQVITLQHVYYDFDKFNIRGDASIDLNHVLSLMQTYPSMKIEMRSHTDSRGTNQYNETLSQNRANEAKTFLISKGISSDRIVARGFGEKELKNQCADGVNCSETEHQKNRRTEIKIIDFNQPGVEVRYND